MKKTLASVAVLGLMLSGPALAAGYGSSGSEQTTERTRGEGTANKAPGSAESRSGLSDQTAAGSGEVKTHERSDLKVGSGETASLSSDQQVVRQIQEHLKSGGYEIGEVDGIMGPRTKQALTEYQKDKGLTASGAIDQELLASMDIDAPQQASTSEEPRQQPLREDPSEGFNVQQPGEERGDNR